MTHNTLEFNSFVHFTELTPEILLNKKKPVPFYEEAFLSGESENNSEFSQNTTTWD